MCMHVFTCLYCLCMCLYYVFVCACIHVCVGIVNVQLEALETKSEVQSVAEVLDEKGRKPIGGKMEVCARLREPITGKV